MKRILPILLVLVPISVLYVGGAFEFLERFWMDVHFRLGSEPVRSSVVLVDIDPKSLRALDVWPWPRGYHATALERLLEAGATRVGFDIDFSSRSIADEDRQLAEALERAQGRVVLPVFLQWQHAWPEEPRLVGVEPLDDFARHAILGSINVQPETDGLVRQYPNRSGSGERSVQSFASALAGDPHPEVASFYLDYRLSPESIPRISFVDVLTGQFDPRLVQGRAVIVGTSAVELNDQIAVPVVAALPGPMLQALAFESLVQKRMLFRQGPATTLIVALLFVLVLGPVFASATWRTGVVLLFGAVSAVVVGVLVLQRSWPVLVDVTPWIFTLVGLFWYTLVQRIHQQDMGLQTQGLAIRRSESLMRNVVENSFDAIVTIGSDGKVETFNRAAQRMFGYDADEAVGLPVADLVQRAEQHTPGSVLVRATGAPVEATGRRKAGSCFPVELVVTAIDTSADPKVVAVLRDITERKAHQDELQHQATHDPLTDLPNRFLLIERVERALENAEDADRPVAILLLDLDRFKEINDVLGHHTGDLLLQQVARRLETPLQPSETIARLGGDEFAVLLPDTDPHEAERVGWRLIEMLRTPFQVERLTFQIDTSIGVALYPEHGSDAETLIQRADVAMYGAKRKRCGVNVYSPDHDFNSIRHLMLRGDLRSAIESHQLFLVFQPKLLAETERVIGVEALVRWTHPQHGPIPPDEFIGLAEHSGLIRQLTQWLIVSVLQQGAAWAAEGLHLKLSLNLSARNLLEEDLPSSVESVLSSVGLPADRLILEITESVLMEDPQRALTVVTKLKDLGVGISIDDFGTGYSSLGYLMRLPANEIKIDRSFVMEMERDPGSATIVHSTIDLAHNLGLEVVAEGVETEATWNVLRELGCDMGQGFFFSRPLPADAFATWVRGRTAPLATPPIGIDLRVEPIAIGVGTE